MLSDFLGSYKKDLSEFVSTVKEDTNSVLNLAAEKLKTGLNEKHAPVKQTGAPPVIPEHFETFLKNTAFETDSAFADFASTFDLEARREHFKTAEEADPAVAGARKRLVPGELSEKDFWQRYFYFRHVHRRARLLAGDDQASQDEEELSWGDDDETGASEGGLEFFEDKEGNLSGETSHLCSPVINELEAQVKDLQEKLNESKTRTYVAEQRVFTLETKVTDLQEQLERCSCNKSLSISPKCEKQDNSSPSGSGVHKSFQEDPRSSSMSNAKSLSPSDLRKEEEIQTLGPHSSESRAVNEAPIPPREVALVNEQDRTAGQTVTDAKENIEEDQSSEDSSGGWQVKDDDDIDADADVSVSASDNGGKERNTDKDEQLGGKDRALEEEEEEEDVAGWAAWE